MSPGDLSTFTMQAQDMESVETSVHELMEDDKKAISEDCKLHLFPPVPRPSNSHPFLIIEPCKLARSPTAAVNRCHRLPPKAQAIPLVPARAETKLPALMIKGSGERTPLNSSQQPSQSNGSFSSPVSMITSQSSMSFLAKHGLVSQASPVARETVVCSVQVHTWHLPKHQENEEPFWHH
ncbi:hypothetical protein DPEC_G00238040 [Dallia pectoralis]|uniref:Uncharacterized protein n=1 Tax=Dallia pectoralis TaxID=75939 RepID=A0ACC2FYL2_DALPE|nr:hypothetical protein DPEC_G00238040 [Dallia pectoralis]